MPEYHGAGGHGGGLVGGYGRGSASNGAGGTQTNGGGFWNRRRTCECCTASDLRFLLWREKFPNRERLCNFAELLGRGDCTAAVGRTEDE